MPPTCGTSGLLADAIRHFPLVERRRPLARPLPERIQRLTDLAREADETDNLTSASAVHNLAALLAADQGLPVEARRLCREHADLYLRAQPLNGPLANRAMEPLVNLGSLEIRLGDGDKGLDLLNRLADAVTSRTDTALDGHPIPLHIEAARLPERLKAMPGRYG
ncbi:hypothetical protein OHV05_36950 (plasmid) [Kitasatospora sp. NBC_00070]|uniref:hypothetical protein n=1 Tax=Kitasatospora sp. NBC_00070 TaxID=2975962 RepID=UPI002F90E027